MGEWSSTAGGIKGLSSVHEDRIKRTASKQKNHVCFFVNFKIILI